MNKKNAQELMAYGRGLMVRVAGGQAVALPEWASDFLALLNAGWCSATYEAPLQSIFTLIATEGEGAAPAYLRPLPLSLAATDALQPTWVLAPVSLQEAADDRSALYREFLAHDGDTGENFHRFVHLMRKYASTLPNTYGEPGVSLFEQWKMVAALVQISGGTDKIPDRLGLVSGDIPGIQRTINTITSKGAAKAMRGRSAFIQLLGQALIERLLNALNLDLPNVIYDAGGNFLLLSGWDDRIADKVGEVAAAVNRVLLAGAGEGTERFDGFHGDLAVALAAIEIPLAALSVPLADAPSSAWQEAEAAVKAAVARVKLRPFAAPAMDDEEGWKLLFVPEPAETDDFCAVCRRQRMLKEPEFRRLADEEGGAGAVCPECYGFNQLADQMGHAAGWLTMLFREPDGVRTWQRALYEISGRWYGIGKSGAAGDIVLALSPDNFMRGSNADGFRLLAHTTPMSGRQIKTNEELAQASDGGLKRLGVLRMDVDNLGDLIVNGLPRRTAMQTAELSQALERFFAGWLDRICDRVGKNLFYVLFAGGDDLFVIGPWTAMPTLAQAVRDDFQRYTSRHERIHLSAGIAVIGEKAPLYAGAEESHEALETAKKLDRNTPQAKNAITFLGQPVHWEQFAQVTELKNEIVGLAEDDGLGNALVTRLLAIARRYYRDQQRGPYASRGKVPPRNTDPVYYGPWMWQQAYALARHKEGRSTDVTRKLKRLEEALLGGQIWHLSLAARWAQWLTRKGA